MSCGGDENASLDHDSNGAISTAGAAASTAPAAGAQGRVTNTPAAAAGTGGAAGASGVATPGLSTMAAARMMAAAAGAAAGGGGAGAPAAASGQAGQTGQAGQSGQSGQAGPAGQAGHATAAAAGSGGSSTNAMGGVVPADAATACGEDAQMVMGMAPRKQGNGNTNLRTSGDVEFTYWKGTMAVPKKPAPERGTLFLWPGLQPLQMDNVVGYGVLQPVLTWGTSCADMTNVSYDHWWISGVYVGTTPGSWTNVSCKAGDAMDVSIGDLLDIEMTLVGTIWKSTMTDRATGKTVTFDYDLKGQKQQWLLHQIEAQGQTKPVDDVIFTNVVTKLSGAQPSSCYPSETGANDYFSPPRASADGKTCCFSKIILRAQGATATSPNEP